MGTGVVDHDVGRAPLGIEGVEQVGNFLLIGGVAGMDLRTGLLRKGGQLVGLAGGQRDGESVLCQQPRQRGAEPRAGADDQCRTVLWLFHQGLLVVGDFDVQID